MGQTCSSANGPAALVVIALGLAPVGTRAPLKPRLGQPARQQWTASRSLHEVASGATIGARYGILEIDLKSLATGRRAVLLTCIFGDVLAPLDSFLAR